jgi:hypothetical protein
MTRASRDHPMSGLLCKPAHYRAVLRELRGGADGPWAVPLIVVV